MRGLSLLILPLIITSCTNKSNPSATTSLPGNPPSAIEAVAVPEPVTPPVPNCEPRAISAEFAAIEKTEKERLPLETATKSSPSPENFRALLEFDRALARSAERALQTVENCTEVSPPALKKLRATEASARANILYLEESLPAANR